MHFSSSINNGYRWLMEKESIGIKMSISKSMILKCHKLRSNTSNKRFNTSGPTNWEASLPIYKIEGEIWAADNNTFFSQWNQYEKRTEGKSSNEMIHKKKAYLKKSSQPEPESENNWSLQAQTSNRSYRYQVDNRKYLPQRLLWRARNSQGFGFRSSSFQHFWNLR